MSELNAYRVYTRMDEGAWGYDPFAEPTDVELNDEQVYIKSEADRYIAHRNAKYCEAMAQSCMEMQCETEQQADFAVRWEHRWLTLATHYKEMAK